MNKIINAVDHLNKLLPLAERQKKLSCEVADVYLKILNSYVYYGRTLNKFEIAEFVHNVDETINTLRNNDMVIFDSNDEPVGAYPFTMETREHKVKVNNHIVYSMCALDALAVSPMFNMKTSIESRCHITGDDILIEQFDQDVLNKESNEYVHFGINWSATKNNCCATSLCTEMIFLKDNKIAENWLHEDIESREIFSLDEAIDFSSQFFKPLVSNK